VRTRYGLTVIQCMALMVAACGQSEERRMARERYCLDHICQGERIRMNTSSDPTGSVSIG
jgi:hypothetical protein